MKINANIEYLYQRYNGYVGDEIPIRKASSLLLTFLDGITTEQDVTNGIIKYEFKGIADKSLPFQELIFDKSIIQPKSIFLKIHYLNMILQIIPDSFFKKYNISRKAILGITVSISLYYVSLQTLKNGIISERKRGQGERLFSRVDFCIDYQQVRKECAIIEEDEFNIFCKLFAKDIEHLDLTETVCLYAYKGDIFILNIEEFVEYILFEVERRFIESATKEEKDAYYQDKGTEFESIAYGSLGMFWEGLHHTAYYFPASDKKVELDIVAVEDNSITVFECKSGTINLQEVVDDAIRLKIHNKVKKAHESLFNFSRYLSCGNEYSLECDGQEIRGRCKDYDLINVQMYSADFVSSNIHTLFPEYISGVKSPVLVISLEHLLAIALDCHFKKKNIRDYFIARKEYMLKYPRMRFENNELDLYYEIANESKGSMFSEMKANGWFEHLNPNARIMGSYHDGFGNEIRPASDMLGKLDEFLLYGILRNGKEWFEINKRYLRFFEEFVSVD